MIKDQCISITDLRRKGSSCLEGLEFAEKYIFSNNKPIAVVLNIDYYEELVPKIDLVRMRDEEITPESRKKMEKVKMKKLSELHNLPC